MIRAVVCFTLLAFTVDPSGPTEAGEPIRATMESVEPVLYPGQDLLVKLTFTGGGDNEAVIGAAAFAREAFTLTDAAGEPPKKSSAPSAPSAEPEPLILRGFDTAERVVNLSAWYPNLTAKKGRWNVTWSHAEMTVGPVGISVVRAYRAAKDDVAVVETELGKMTWELLPEHAPAHVKHFVDLARSGFYDGLTIFRVIPGLEAVGGDPKGDGTGAWSRLLAPEIDLKVKMGTGMVGASRQETSMTSDSMFFITLSPSEYMLGKQTFFARLTDGWEVIAKLHPLASKGDTGLRDSYLLLTPVKILRVTIR